MNLEEIARLERNRYQREYRKRNPDKIKAANDRYWAKKAEERAKNEAGNNEACP